MQSVVFTGHPNAIGRLNDPLNATGMHGGLLLGTGRVTTALGSVNQLSSHIFGNAPTTDPWIEALNVFQSEIYDRAAVTINFIAQTSSLPLAFRFGSEDYLEYVCSNNIDLGGVFISGPGLSGDFPNEGINLAVVPGTTHIPVCVNTVNTGVPGSEPETFADYCTAFALNWTNYTSFYAGPITSLVYDGFTTVLPTRPVTLIPGQPYQLRITIADTGDPGFNSVLLFGNINGGDFTYQDTVAVSTGFCAGESVSLYGQTFSQAGYYEISQTVGDTQRLVQITVAQYPAFLFTETIEACPGDEFTVGNTVLVAPAEYTLALTTSQGCDSIIHYVIQTKEVGFPVFNPLPVLCTQDTLTYVFGRDFGLSGLPMPFINREEVPIPDAAGTANIPIQVSGYPADSLLTDANELAICLNLEHSFMYDLEISLVCPTGQSVTLHPYNPILPPGIGSTQLGIPNDPDDPDAPNTLSTPWGPVQPGIGWSYCWTTDATRGTLWQYATNNMLSSLPPGDYNASDALSDLEGCPLNGEWSLEVTDHWPTDNGYIFEASLDFNRSVPPLVRGWTALDTNVVAVQGDSLVVSFGNPGDYPYIFFVEGNDGCSYDTTFTFRVRPAIAVVLDTAICGYTFLDQTFQSPGAYVIEKHYASPNFCDSLVRYELQVFFPDTTFITRSSCVAAEVGTELVAYPTGGVCDSIVVTTTLYAPLISTDTLNTCDPEAVGDYLLALTTAEGCDSLVTLTYVYSPLQFDVITTPASCQTGLGSISVVPLDASYQYSFSLGNQTSTAGTFEVAPGTYSISYSTADGCTGSLSATVGAGQLPQSAFTATPLDCQGLRLQTTQPPNTQVNWIINGVPRGSGEDVSVWNLPPGFQTVCIQASNGCGLGASTCIVVSIESATQGAYSLTMGTGSAEPDSCAWIALTAYGLQDLAYVSGIISLANAAPIQITELVPGDLPGGAFDYSPLDPTSLFFEWSSPPPGLNLNDNDTLLLIRVCANSNAAIGVYPLILDGLAAEYCGAGIALDNPPLTINGSFEVVQPLSLAGKIVHHPSHALSGIGIPHVQVNISHTPATMTDAVGFYQARVEAGANYSIKPRKDQPLAGLSTLNLIRLLRHLNGQLPLNSPYLLLAADADCNQIINYDDLIVLRQTLVGGDGNLAGCRTWKFVPRNFVFGLNPLVYPDSLYFTNVTESILTADFYGVRTGDVLGTATANRGGQPLLLQAPDRAYAQAEVINLALRPAEALSSLAGFQLHLAYDPEAISVLGWKAADAQTAGEMVNDAPAGRCRIVAYSDQPLRDDLLGWVQLRINKPLGSLEGALSLVTDDPFASEVYDQDYNVRPVSLGFGAAPSDALKLDAWPNPFSESTQLSIQLPEAGWISLEVRDMSGRLLWQEGKLAEAGLVHWLLSPPAGTPSGVLLVSIRTDKEIKTIRLNRM